MQLAFKSNVMINVKWCTGGGGSSICSIWVRSAHYWQFKQTVGGDWLHAGHAHEHGCILHLQRVCLMLMHRRAPQRQRAHKCSARHPRMLHTGPSNPRVLQRANVYHKTDQMRTHLWEEQHVQLLELALVCFELPTHKLLQVVHAPPGCKVDARVCLKPATHKLSCRSFWPHLEAILHTHMIFNQLGTNKTTLRALLLQTILATPKSNSARCSHSNKGSKSVHAQTD